MYDNVISQTDAENKTKLTAKFDHFAIIYSQNLYKMRKLFLGESQKMSKKLIIFVVDTHKKFEKQKSRLKMQNKEHAEQNITKLK